MDGGRAIAYLRVSVVGDRAARGRLESPDLQLDAIRAWCASRKVEVVEVVRDLNRSGGTLTRPGLEEALRLVKEGAADGIVVARSDRASRRTVDGLGLIDKLDGLGAWIAAADGTIDTTDRVARLATTMMFAMAEHELERYREQSAVIHERAIVEKGRHMGPAPFGYIRDERGRLAPDPEREEVVREVFRRRADGAGWVTLARDLEQRGVRHRNGTRITSSLLRRMVTRRTYVGEAYHGAHVHADAHPPLVDPLLWAAANRVVPAVRSSPSTGRAHPESLLRGLLRCAGCRYALKRLPTRAGKMRWVCRARMTGLSATHDCAEQAVVRASEAEALEALVVERFFALAVGEAVERGEGQADGAGAVAAAEATLDELSSLELRRELGAKRWARMVADARSQLEQASRTLAREQARARTAGADAATLTALWEQAPLASRQEFLRGMIQAVMVTADGPLVDRVHVIPAWEPIDVPRKGGDFLARPWRPGSP